MRCQAMRAAVGAISLVWLFIISGQHTGVQALCRDTSECLSDEVCCNSNCYQGVAFVGRLREGHCFVLLTIPSVDVACIWGVHVRPASRCVVSMAAVKTA